MNIQEIKDKLNNYDGEEITIMEVCGSHTAAIAKYGIKGLLSPKIHLISGPGCPVCVTPSAYVDRLIELSFNETVVTFGDLIRVPGSTESLGMAKSRGAKIKMVYSPMDVLDLAKKHPEENYVFAAVGFETTAPVYTLLLDCIVSENINNIKLLTAIKTMPSVVESLIKDKDSKIDAFLAPGHVAAITGSDYFADLAKKHRVPFGVAGFEPEELLVALTGIVNQIQNSPSSVENYYPSVVSKEGNLIAKRQIEKYFEPCDAVWRGIGVVKDSGLILRKEFSCYDAGSKDLVEDNHNKACRCGEVLTGKISSKDCPLFGKICNPQEPKGACMVSFEGSCYQNYLNKSEV